MRHLIISLCLIVVIFRSFAQETIAIKDATGEYELSDDITPKQAKELAIEEAKKDALRKAGVVENIQESSVLYSLSSSRDFKQFFNSISTGEISGAITGISNTRILKAESSVTGRSVYIAKIDAQVIKYSKNADPSFDFAIKGLIDGDKYRASDHINFSLQSASGGYLKIFIIRNDGVDLLYPNAYEKTDSIKKNTIVNFPTVRGIEYGFEHITKEESQLIMIVLTKEPVPFFKEVNYENVIAWIYGISPDQRRVKSYPIVVVNDK